MRLPQLPSGVLTSSDEVSRRIQLVLWHNRPGAAGGERRGERRYSYPHPIDLLPVEKDGITPAGEAFTVLGKDLAESGIGFYHTEPLTIRHVQATFKGEAFQTCFLVELTWCRFRRQGLFENGGMLLRAVS